MAHKYYGSISSLETGTLFEGLYASKSEGIKELTRKGREEARKGDYNYNIVNLDLFCGERLVATGKVRSGYRPAWDYYPALEVHDIGSLPLGAVKIC
jgi:hypothetical protein